MLGVAKRTQVNGVEIAHGELGLGPPIVLLHGLADNHRTWRRVAPILAKTHRVLMPDLPGHGWSSRPDAPYTSDWYAEILAGWMRANDLSCVPIIGHSFGGGIALTMLRKHGELVERLALVAPGGLGREVCFWLRVGALPLARRLFESIVLRRWMTTLAVHFGPARFSRPEADELERYRALAALPGSGLALHRTITSCLGFDGQRASFWDDAHKLTSLPPVAIFWGERDGVVPFAHGRTAIRRLLHSTLHSYPRVGHFPHLDCPEIFACDLLRFLGDSRRDACRLSNPGLPCAEISPWVEAA